MFKHIKFNIRFIEMRFEPCCTYLTLNAIYGPNLIKTVKAVFSKKIKPIWEGGVGQKGIDLKKSQWGASYQPS